MRFKIHFGVVIVLLAEVAILTQPSVAEESSVGPDGVTRIIVEAEDMKGVDWKNFGAGSPEWRVGRHGFDFYQNNTFGGHWQSRFRTAMTDKGDSPAEIHADVEVPKSGKYKLWVKYECPPFFNYAFDVTVTGKGGKTLLHKTFGLIESHKHFSFTDKMTYGDLYWAWGMDHDAAEGDVLELPAGKLRLTIAKTKNPEPAGARSIDAIMITDDLSELSSPRFARYPLLDELRRANRVFMRYRLPAEALGPVHITWNRWGKRYPDFYQVGGEHMVLVRAYDSQGNPLLGTDGKPKALPNGQLAEALKPGETSVWLNIGPALNVESAATFHCTAELLGPDGNPLKEQPSFIPFAVDFALRPEGKRIEESFETLKEENTRHIVLLLQPDMNTEDGQQFTMKLADAYRLVTAELEKTARKAPVPKRMRFFGGTGFPQFLWGKALDERSWVIGMELRRALGLNTVPGNAYSGEEIKKQRDWLKKQGIELTHSLSYHHSQEPEAVAKVLKENGSTEDFYYLSFGDEIGLPAIDVSKPEVVTAFHDHLKKRNVGPQDLGLASWDIIKPLNAFSADVAVQIGVIPKGQKGAAVDKTLKRLYWHSSQFRIEQGIGDFVAKTNRLRELIGPNVHTSANLGGMHPFYWVHQSSFIEAFKHNAMTLAFSEDYDYCQPETSRLVVEFLAGYLKAGTKYRGQRIQFYCMPHFPGNSPEHLLQNAVLMWGQNVKDLDWFVGCPDGYSTENYVNIRGGLPTFRSMRTINEMAGAVEDWLEPAQPVPATVALLLSEASDTWELGGLGQWDVKPSSEGTNAFQEERKNTYFALRNAGYRVDLMTEADVRDGTLKNYKALYVGGENMEQATAAAVAEWVKNGGILYASVGAARKDEYDEPLTALDSVLGRAKRIAYQRYKGALRTKLELLLLKPKDTVKLADGSSFDALATFEKFEAAKGATVLATYSDGSPAAVSAKLGQGAGYYVGTCPGEAWAKKAFPVQPMGKGGPETNASQFEPVNFDAAPANVILRPLTDAGLQPDIRISQPNIVCNRLSSPKGTVIMIVNLGAQQKGEAKEVTLTVNGLGEPTKVWSYAYRKGLSHEVKDGVLTVRFSQIGLADILVVETKAGQ